MINRQTVLAVVPARGGSKRAPKKNITEFRGKMLIQWAFESARPSCYIDRLVLSTEDAEVAQIARNIGYEVIDRPPEFATDTATCEDVLRHVFSIYPADWIVLLQPCSPLRSTEDIDVSIELAQRTGSCITYGTDGIKNGAVYVARKDILAHYNFSFLGATIHYMSTTRSLDIDYPGDFQS